LKLDALHFCRGSVMNEKVPDLQIKI